MVEIVDWMVTGVCNLQCPFCYGPDPLNTQVMDIKQVESVSRFLKEQDIRGINVAGGEPTLYPYLRESLMLWKSMGFWICLQSNATRPKVIRELLSNIDCLAVPIDTTTSALSKRLRTSEKHPDTTVSVLESNWLNNWREEGGELKVSTVLTRPNLNSLPEIYNLVTRARPDVWKIHQFRPRGEGKINQSLLEISDYEFKQALSTIDVVDLDFKVSSSEVSESIGSYLILNPDSEILVPQSDHYFNFGKLLGADNTVNKIAWQEALHALNFRNHQDNIKKAFPLSLHRTGIDMESQNVGFSTDKLDTYNRVYDRNSLDAEMN